ncbi:MAG: hypothetical protein EOO54_10655 [Haliea sp.]|nr:MAG: hypothetical protein EOO54_10655 [Haliea sp.]
MTLPATTTGPVVISFVTANVPTGNTISHALAWRAVDSLNNVSTSNFQITVAHAAPAAPVITSPQSGLTTRTAQLPVSGTAAVGSSVQLLVGGQPSGPVLTTSNGSFSGSVTLAAGGNQVQARATDAYGQSAPSAAVSVTLDTAVPSGASNLSAAALADGKVRLSWARSTDPNAIGYDLYRSRSAFSSISAATKANASPITGTSYEDLPNPDGLWYYRLVAVNAVFTPSVPTDQVQVTADGAAPKALSIAYTPLGKVDSATGRIGQGKVNVLLTVSEGLQSPPYLGVHAQGGTHQQRNCRDLGRLGQAEPPALQRAASGKRHAVVWRRRRR